MYFQEVVTITTSFFCYFSVYAYNPENADTVVAKIEKPYDYFDKPWYRTAATLGKPCWVEAYAEDLQGVESTDFDDMIARSTLALGQSDL